MSFNIGANESAYSQRTYLRQGRDNNYLPDDYRPEENNKTGFAAFAERKQSLDKELSAIESNYFETFTQNYENYQKNQLDLEKLKKAYETPIEEEKPRFSDMG